jgi:hypothetical protein
LFCGGVLRRLAAEVLGGGRDVHAGMAKVIHNSHGNVHLPRSGIERRFDTRLPRL